MICDFGCGKESTHQFKNGKRCCCKTASSCDAMRLKNSKGNSQTVIDLDEAQRLYDSGISWAAVADRMGVKYTTLVNKVKFLNSRSFSEAGKLAPPKTQETRDKLSIIAKAANFGGYVPGAGRGKRGRYKGFICDSSWELAFVVYCLDHHINLQRNTNRFEYEFENKTRHYIPDFVCNGEYIEIKGFDSDEWKAKLSAFPHPIKVLYRAEIDFYLEYAKTTYGVNFIDLYE